MRRLLIPSALLAGALLLVGCQGEAQGDIATWELLDPVTVSATTTQFDVAVTRLACANGETGTVRAPRVFYEEDRVVITIDVDPLPDGAYTCQGNDAVAVSVTLSEPIGDRRLVDGACSQAGAVRTVFCENDGIRWG